MQKPMIQIALDHRDLKSAIGAVANVSSFVDIIEIGTILAFSEGVYAVSTLREKYPGHIIVCDLKTTDGGKILSQMAFEAGAHWLTVSAAAHPATMAACCSIAAKFGGEIQVEIYGNWSMRDAEKWVEMGIKQAIYHRSRDAETAGVSWKEEDVKKMRQLSDIGLELSITGGIIPEEVHFFKGLRVKAFIAGRALSGENGYRAAEALRRKIDYFWS